MAPGAVAPEGLTEGALDASDGEAGPVGLGVWVPLAEVSDRLGSAADVGDSGTVDDGAGVGEVVG